MSMERRRFLGLSIGAAVGATIGIPAGRFLGKTFSSADSSLYPPKGVEGFVLSVCAECPGGCGLRVRRIGERAVKLEGNPLHPVNAGRLCPRGQAALQGLYHPDRLSGPLRRVGPRGSLRSFERTSWDRALDEISGRLRSLRDRRRPEALVLARGGAGGIGVRVAQRFLSAFGSPNDVTLDRGEEAATLALFLGQGVRTTPAFDVQSTDYVLSLGAALLEAWSSPVYMTRAYGEFRQGRTGRRGKLVQVEPRLSITASSADEWIAVRPGTEGVFALGIASVIVAEGLYAKEFVLEQTSGFEGNHDAHPALRTLLEKQYGLERVAADTGISGNVILRIAREFAAARSRVAVGPRRGPLVAGRLFDHLAAQTLNALVGSLDAPGGVLVPEEVPLASWPPLPADPISEAGRAQPRLDGAGARGKDFPLLSSDPERLSETILAGFPYPADVVLLVGADPVFGSAAPGRLAAALERVPVVVSFGTIADDSALHADWILPEAHFLERWDLYPSPPGVPFPLVSLARPAVSKPKHDVRPLAEIFLDLARRVGGDVARAFPWKDLPTLLRSEMDGLYQARRGAIMGTPFDEAWVRMMEGAGWWAPGYRSADELWEKSQETGGWWDPFYDFGDWKRVMATKSGRFEFRADLLASPTRETPIPAGSLALYLFEPLPIAGGRGAELPFLQGILDPGYEERWETWAEIHPESATPLGIGDRDWIRVASPQGAIVARARLSPRVVPGVVAIPIGLGKRAGGRWASGIGANPMQLLSPARDPLCGLPDLDATRVQVSVLKPPVVRAERKD
ncbi:MAG: molybdopterin-dependent oxidoreductase [Thermoanaerobaculia bacterium]